MSDVAAQRRLPSWLPDALSMVSVLLVVLVGWELVVRLTGIRPAILPGPVHVFEHFVGNLDTIAVAAGHTAIAFGIGFAVATVLALATAVLIVALPRFGRGLYPIIIGVQTVPVIAVAPLMIIWLGFGLRTIATVSMILAYFPTVVGTVSGFQSVAPSSIDLMRSLPAGRVMVFRKLMFPAALPSIFAGLRTAAVLSVIGAVVGEFVAGGQGLAADIVLARAQYQTDRVMADIVALAILGSVFYSLIAAVERFVTPWRRRAVASRPRRP